MGKYKVCLEYYFGNCLGFCEDKYFEVVYNENIDVICNILKGNFKELFYGFKK